MPNPPDRPRPAVRLLLAALVTLAALVAPVAPAVARPAPHDEDGPATAAARLGPPAATGPATRGRSTVLGRSAVLVDAATGEVLWSRDANTPRPPASLTKMVTALTAERSLPPRRRLTVSRAATLAEPSHLGLKAGQTLSAEQALRALMMMSANDMAITLAESAAGSQPRFFQAMNAQGRHLGMTHSTWRSPNGLDTPGHVSTAWDLAIAGRAVLRDPWLAGVVRTRKTVTITVGGGVRKPLYIKSHYLHDNRDAIGVKTGFTGHAGRCLAAAATRGGRTLIAVVLNSPDPPKDAARLMDWGFGPGRATRTGQVLPPYVAPLGVDALLPPTTVAPPTTQPAQVQAGTVGGAGVLAAPQAAPQTTAPAVAPHPPTGGPVTKLPLALKIAAVVVALLVFLVIVAVLVARSHRRRLPYS